MFTKPHNKDFCKYILSQIIKINIENNNNNESSLVFLVIYLNESL